MIIPRLVIAFILAPLVVAHAQETPTGAVIESVELSGVPIAELSPSLQQDITALAGERLNSDRLIEIITRIEAERPDVVVSIETEPRSDGRVHLVLHALRIGDETGVAANINARYVVERVDIEGIRESVLSQSTRDALQGLVGARLDPDRAEELMRLIRAELPGYRVGRSIRKGTEPGKIFVTFEVREDEAARMIRFAPSRTKVVYQSDQGWSGVFDLPIGGRDKPHRFTAGFVMDNNDDLVEEYSGYRLRLESRKVTRRLGLSLEFSRFTQHWRAETVTALGDRLDDRYRVRRTIEPLATFAFHPSFRVVGGASVTELEPDLDGLPASSLPSRMASVGLLGLGFDRRWAKDDDAGQRVSATYELRAATDSLGSDLTYTRQLARAGFRLDRGSSTVIAEAMAGRISGDPPLFERFSLGDSSTLRGWNKFEIAPVGGNRVVHQSLEYRYHQLAYFVDVGSVWQHGFESRTHWSTGFGLHTNNFFLTFAFPLNANDVDATFLVGVRF